ncbi:MAG: protein-L-isoaspartate O-methyltransferase family protein [Rhabdaerophilum sp.]
MIGRGEARVAFSARDGSGVSSEPGDTALARFLLELRQKGVTEPTMLNAFERVPRAAFMPAHRPSLLYQPIALPIPCGEEAEDPFTLARLMLLARVAPGHRVLEIGTGSGFGTALLAAIGAEVISLERYRSLGNAARANLASLGLERAQVHQADGLAKRGGMGPLDRLIIGGALDLVPQHLFEGLVPGGIAIGGRVRGREARLTLWRIDASGFPVETDLGACRMSPMRSGLPVFL